MPRSTELKIERNQLIIKRYDELKKMRKWHIDEIFKRLKAQFFLEINTLQKIVYNRKRWIENIAA